MMIFLYNISSLRSESPKTSHIFFDAERSAFDREGTTHEFEGNVIAIAAKMLITADKIKIDKAQNKVTGEGHIIILANDQVITGSSLTLNTLTNEFTLSEAAIVNYDPKLISDITNRVLGFSQRELNFEISRQNQLQKINAEKANLREIYRKKIHTRNKYLTELLEKYVLLLEKEQLIKNQPNAHLAAMSKDRKDSLLKRRDFWRDSRNLPISTSLNKVGYFRISGQNVVKMQEGRFSANKAFISPCHCNEEETPTWGFWAEKIDGQSGAYADLHHPVIKIKSIPIFYLPALKIPLKSQRQSGFLLPNISHTSTNGTMFSQPVFLAFNKSIDATLFIDSIEKRGQKFGIESRFQSKKYSGWEFKIDAIRDKLWLNLQQKRSHLINTYVFGVNRAIELSSQNSDWSKGLPEEHPEFNTISDPRWWISHGLEKCLNAYTTNQCVQHELTNFLKLPQNSWRGHLEWKGQSIIAPRLNLISHGKILSDHRYEEDLWVPSIKNFNSGATSDLYSVSRARIHLDGENFYLGIGSHIADPVLSLDSYSGYQVPFYFKFQPRIIQISKKNQRFPLYLQLDYEQRRIEVFKESSFPSTLPINQSLHRLGNGNWQRTRAELNSPLTKGSIIQADFFSKFEYQSTNDTKIHSIYHNLSDSVPKPKDFENLGPSFLHTINSGFHFSLPLDGRWKLVNPSSNLALNDKENISKILEHQMNWDVTVALRSYVAKRGPYGTSYEYSQYHEIDQQWKGIEGSRKLIYYESDRNIAPSQNISFSTTHNWITYNQTWNQKSPNLFTPENKKKTENLREIARKELLYSLDRPIRGHKFMFDKDGNSLTNHYELSKHNYNNPVHLFSQISFDYLKLQSREKIKQSNLQNGENITLPEPWTPLDTQLRFNWAGMSLYMENSYNLYNNFVSLVLMS